MNAGREASGAAGAPDSVATSRWDPVVRLTHWGVAVAVLVNGVLIEGGSAAHVWIGWGALVLLALRLIWGLVGSEEARFSAFPPDPRGALAHAAALATGKPRSYRSHNPLGALMVYTLWATLAVVVVTGVMMAGSPFSPAEAEAAQIERGPALTTAAGVQAVDADGDDAAEGEHEGAGEDGRAQEGDEMVEEIHEVAANLLLVLAALHVGGVVLEQRLGGTDIVRAMTVGGRRRA